MCGVLERKSVGDLQLSASASDPTTTMVSTIAPKTNTPITDNSRNDNNNNHIHPSASGMDEGERTNKHSEPLLRQEMVIPTFLHLPKTGGSTLLSILHDNLLPTVSAAPPQAGDDGGETRTGGELLFFGMPPFLFQLRSSLERLKDRTQYLGGHIGLADIQMIEHLDPEFHFVPFTLLREPNERLLSFKAYLDDLAGGGGGGASQQRSLAEFLDSMLPNSMYRLLAPLGSNISDEQTTLQRIKEALVNDFAVVGLTERFDETLMLLKRKGILHDISYTRHKVLDGRPKFSDLSAEERRMITRHNYLDQELYQFASDLFGAIIKKQDASFQRELSEFQNAQKLRGEERSCEDDSALFGAWACDPEVRKATFENRKETLQRIHEARHPQALLIQQLLETQFRRRYW